jgi:hypothetical protein
MRSLSSEMADFAPRVGTIQQLPERFVYKSGQQYRFLETARILPSFTKNLLRKRLIFHPKRKRTWGSRHLPFAFMMTATVDFGAPLSLGSKDSIPRLFYPTRPHQTAGESSLRRLKASIAAVGAA